MTDAEAPERPWTAPSVDLTAALLLVVVSAALGGASRGAPLALAAVELASLPLLWVAVRRLAAGGRWRAAAAPLTLLALAMILPWLQLVPLPPAIWTALPGRALLAEAPARAGLAPGWRPVSLSPDDTLRAALALIPPAAMFLAAITLGPRERRLAAAAWIVMGLAGLALGAAQLTAPTYLYAETTRGTVTGFFANRNHQASMLLGLIPLAAVGAAGLAGERRERLAATLCALFLPLAIIGLAAIRSRAGVILCAPALLGALALGWRAAGGRKFWPVLLAAGCVAAVGAVLAFGLSPILQRFVGDGRAEARFEVWPHAVAMAQAYQPVGGGIGAFDRLFRQVEPLSLVTADTFVHAHNEVLEIWVEAGWIGLALATAFLVWLLSAIARAWFTDRADALRAAAGLTALLLLAHAMVDYGLRNPALAVLLAFSCGSLASPRDQPARGRGEEAPSR